MKHPILFLCFCVTSLMAQQTEYVDFKTAKVEIGFSDKGEIGVGGFISYEFDILKDIDSVYIDAKGFDLIYCSLDEEEQDSIYDGKRFIIKRAFKAKNTHKLDVFWSTRNPKKAIYFIDWKGNDSIKDNRQVWTQGQGKYTSNWMPSIDDMNEKIEFDINISFVEGYEVISNGKLLSKDTDNNGFTKWHYDMKHPMPSYLVALAIGKYDKKVEYSKSGIPLEMYYYPEDSLKFEPTYRYTKQMFDFLEEEIGVPYPWQNYKMVPVKDFLYAGMENTSLNIYSDAFVVDSIAFVDKNFVNINAHELAHQWFGDLVTATHGTHHWLQEGFATYYALLAEKEIFGEDYYYWRLYEYAQELHEQDKAGKSTSLLDPKSSSTTFYKKGCWVLHMLREKVGDTAFKQAVKNYLKKHQFKNVETDDFISEVEKSSGEDLSEFVVTYLKDTSDFYFKRKIKDLEFKLINSKLSLRFLRCGMENKTEFHKSNRDKKLKSLKNDSLSSSAQEWIFDDLQTDSLINQKEVFKYALVSKNIKLRQRLAQTLVDIPSELKTDYESLLKDKSYITIETALFNLWKNFSEDRGKYLNQTKDVIGSNDKNVRILWLTLALITKDYQPENKAKYFQELTDYTSDNYGFEVRQNAFQYLHQIQACNDSCKENLKQAATHHNWRFKQFAKSLLD
ncbi:M1 family metallopeptidase [Hyunsoonleella ulvae]|uniref:M1 family metallopeptidase n=1 Tax=Hyunsoonleella ulvae TaxID=2799948 RepID=UPI00193A3A2F|nr:M1 family metallopeptidase [Hyunsoonleella ulvae]